VQTGIDILHKKHIRRLRIVTGDGDYLAKFGERVLLLRFSIKRFSRLVAMKGGVRSSRAISTDIQSTTETDWPSRPDRAHLHERETSRWLTTESPLASLAAGGAPDRNRLMSRDGTAHAEPNTETVYAQYWEGV
jgi:hypothetical protein